MIDWPFPGWVCDRMRKFLGAFASSSLACKTYFVILSQMNVGLLFCIRRTRSETHTRPAVGGRRWDKRWWREVYGQQKCNNEGRNSERVIVERNEWRRATLVLFRSHGCLGAVCEGRWKIMRSVVGEKSNSPAYLSSLKAATVFADGRTSLAPSQEQKHDLVSRAHKKESLNLLKFWLWFDCVYWG